jgi:3-oxoacyl-[acyl-carrier protein] reductase
MRTICITGATTGIGAALATLIPRAGDRLFLQYYQNEVQCRSLAERTTDDGIPTTVIQADFAADPDGAARAMADAISGEADRLDILINNAGGIIKRDPVGTASFDVISRTVNLNLLGPMMLTTYLMPLLQASANGPERRADVINITSIAARSGSPSSASYGAAKAGLENFTRALAKEAGPGIRVNSVSPGVIDTPFHHGTTSREVMDGWLAATPIGHHGRPEDIAAAVAFVLENDFMTGAVVPVNGGIQMI